EDVRAWHLFHGLKLGQERVYDKLFLLKAEYVYIVGAMLKNSDGVPELQIFVMYLNIIYIINMIASRNNSCYCAYNYCYISGMQQNIYRYSNSN
ncbi:MAG: hypothetical protein K2K40_08345, partial [Paramuribaculum sp.]|nr:hypothetical protein [Paramuribaculum sp.]